MATRIDLRGVMELAGRNLLANLDPARHFLPNWGVYPKADGSVNFRRICPSHNLGRWWDATLRLESATGFPIPKNAEMAMLENLKRFFDNPEHLCLQPLDLDVSMLDPGEVSPVLDLHSLREGLLALTALTCYRQNAWAREKGKAMCGSLLRLTHEDGTWVEDQFEAVRRGELSLQPHGSNCNTHGRLIEALVEFYEATGEPDALRAAGRFARYHLAYSTYPDGTFRLKPDDHTHSYLGTLRGLLRFGELTGQREYIDTVHATYATTVRKLITKSGFISHNLLRNDGTETTSPGDVAQLALWLALRHNQVEYLDDVERIVRARLVPCQITDLCAKTDPEDAPLLLGAMGGMCQKPHSGKNAVFDITAAVLHSLVDVYRHIAVTHDSDLRVNFHFDYEDANVRITSRRDKIGTVTVTPKAKLNLWLRLPRCAIGERLAAAGKPIPLHVIGSYAFVSRDLLPAEVTLTYELPLSHETERTDNVDYIITWRGDEIIGISPNSHFQPFYPDAFVEHGWK